MLRGSPLRLWAQEARSLAEVEFVQPFGDNLHLITTQGKLAQVIEKLEMMQEPKELFLEQLEPIPATLEDAFVSILQREESR